MAVAQSRFRGNYIGFLYIIIFTFFSLCPFVFPVMESDVQPYAFLLSVLLVLASLLHPHRTPYIIVSVATAIVAVLFFLLDPSQYALRLFYGYFSFAFILIASFYSVSKYGDYLETVIKMIILLWFLVGMVQLLGGDKRFLGFLVSGARTTSDRGVFGLASEPSFFGVQCFYFLFLVSLFKKHKLLFIGICVIMSVFMAQSTLGVIFLTTYLLLFAFDTKKVKVIIPTILIIVALGIYVVTNDSGGRLTYLLGEFLSNNMGSFEDDQSTTVRLNSILSSWGMVFDSHFLPQGFSDRFGCLIGDALIVFGFIGLPLIFMILTVLSKSFSSKGIIISAFFLFFLLLNSNIQISNPSLAFVLGYLLSKQDSEHNYV